MATQPETISIPSFEGGEQGDPRNVPYERVLDDYTSGLEQLPRFIRSLQETDREGWNQLLQDVSEAAQRNPEIADLLNVEEVLRIGDFTAALPQDAKAPTSFIHPGLAAGVIAFGVGWAIGSACFNAGWCDFTDYMVQ